MFLDYSVHTIVSGVRVKAGQPGRKAFSNDLFFFDFVGELLECGVAKAHAIRQFFSPLPF